MSYPFRRSTRYILFSFILTGTFFFACKSLQKNPVSFTPPVIKPTARILVFTKTKGFYHESIPTGAAALKQMAAANYIHADTTNNAEYFNDDSLKNYQAIVFLNTTMNVLNADQQVEFERQSESDHPGCR
jgi:cytochrome c